MYRFKCPLRIAQVLVAASLFSGCGNDGTSPATNHTPSITSLIAAPDTVEVGGSVTITCVASDGDNDSLEIAWDPRAGTVIDSGMSVTWTAPAAPAICTIVATVSDEGGKSDVDSVDVVVTEAAIPPSITSLTANPVIVAPGGESTIICAASGGAGDSLSYAWNAQEGSIAGIGDSIVWTAPGTVGIYPIIVTVADSAGTSVTDTITVDVLEGTLLLQTRDGITTVQFDGSSSILNPAGGAIELLGTRIFYYRNTGIGEIDHNGNLVATTQIAEDRVRGYGFTMLPDGGFAVMTNRSDSIFVLDSLGTLVAEMAMPDSSPNSLQNLDGVIAENHLIISETGNNQLVSVDLTTFEATILATIDDGESWLGAIEYNEDGTFYLSRGSRMIQSFTEGGAVENLCSLPEYHITGLVSVGSYLFAVVNHEGTLYRINRFTGEFVLILDGLNYPEDIEYLPVTLD